MTINKIQKHQKSSQANHLHYDRLSMWYDRWLYGVRRERKLPAWIYSA